MQSQSTSPLMFEPSLIIGKSTTVATAVSIRQAWSENSNVPNANFNPNNRKVNFNANNPDNVNDNARFRSSDEGFCAYTDFLHPPSILPISSICECNWNIFVSLVSFNSSKSLSLSVAVSSFALALIR